MNHPAGAIFHKQLGDTVLLQPALQRLLARSHGVEFKTHPSLESLVRLMGLGIHAAHGHLSAGEILAFDTSSATAWQAWRASCPRKILAVFDKPAPGLKHRWIFDEIRTRPGGLLHRSRFFWEITGGSPTDRFLPPRLEKPPENWLPECVRGRPYILLHATSAWKRKCWHASTWNSLLAELSLPDNLLLVGTSGPSPWEKSLASAIRAPRGHEWLSLAGSTSLQSFMALIAGARALLAVDGAASHLAQAFQVPCLTVFGRANPAHWHWEEPKRLALDLRNSPTTPDGFLADPGPEIAATLRQFVLDVLRS